MLACRGGSSSLAQSVNERLKNRGAAQSNNLHANLALCTITLLHLLMPDEKTKKTKKREKA